MPKEKAKPPIWKRTSLQQIKKKAYDADSLLTDYCTLLYKKHGSYEEVARRMKMDRRTVKKYISSEFPSSEYLKGDPVV